MRMSGFLIGGILGACAALYFSRNQKPMLLTNVDWDKAVDKAGQIVRSAKTMWDSASVITAAGEKSSTSSGKALSGNTSSAKSSSSEASLHQVEQLVSKDAALKRQVDEIMKESGTNLQ